MQELRKTTDHCQWYLNTVVTRMLETTVIRSVVLNHAQPSSKELFSSKKRPKIILGYSAREERENDHHRSGYGFENT